MREVANELKRVKELTIYKCSECKKPLECNCFDVDFDEYHLPFCSRDCLIKAEERSPFIDDIDDYNHHNINCENQFDIEDNDTKDLIKSLQKNGNTWEQMAISYNEMRKKGRLAFADWLEMIYELLSDSSDLGQALKDSIKAKIGELRKDG